MISSTRPHGRFHNAVDVDGGGDGGFSGQSVQQPQPGWVDGWVVGCHALSTGYQVYCGVRARLCSSSHSHLSLVSVPFVDARVLDNHTTDLLGRYQLRPSSNNKEQYLYIALCRSVSLSGFRKKAFLPHRFNQTLWHLARCNQPDASYWCCLLRLQKSIWPC